MINKIRVMMFLQINNPLLSARYLSGMAAVIFIRTPLENAPMYINLYDNARRYRDEKQ
ncbi:TPA: hypothetical protein L9L67_004748 [Klebsiella quasipneumoniae subsp. quasipneumoniae]|nr:hypothetical protein [Klebsiella quasipneumoniae subsp. quasipneumoniae]HBR1692048.1 hypothetical protein [Klebsiella quasipneumoniae subsp. quasipneumoniae]HBR1957778.1 hypothetical protein [Klebsiella quasipneumoniae subsp. quasipneumoniae]